MDVLIDAQDLRRYNRLQAEIQDRQAQMAMWLSQLEEKYGFVIQRDTLDLQRGVVIVKETRDANNPS